MACYDPSTSILAGMDPALLRLQLANLQQAYIDLSTGAKVEVASYAQGDGTKAVTYTRANLAQLTSAIRLLQAQLGLISTPRRALNVRF